MPVAIWGWASYAGDHGRVIDRSAPVLVHAWLGPLYRNGTQELIGSIALDPIVRTARQNGGHDVEILLEVNAVSPGPQLNAHVDACASRIQRALDRLPEHLQYAVDHAPAEWLRHVGTQPGPSLIQRLFLEGIEVSLLLCVSLAFDFGDLDMLMVRLDEQGHGDRVFLRP
jgi:hypothetical protein